MFRELTQSFLKKPKNVCFEGEDSDEEILYILRQSIIVNIGWVALTAILFLTPDAVTKLFLSQNIDFSKNIDPGFAISFNLFWYLFSFGYAFERFLNWYFNVYIVTNKRIIDMDFSYLLNRRVSEAPLRNVEDITLSTTGILQTVFDFGDISIQTAGEKREIEFYNIAKPGKVQDMLSDLVSNVKGTYA